jgi:hypothetical protein
MRKARVEAIAIMGEILRDSLSYWGRVKSFQSRSATFISSPLFYVEVITRTAEAVGIALSCRRDCH